MAQTHEDRDFGGERDRLFEELKKRAEGMTQRAESQITAGFPGEPQPVEREYGSMRVAKLPDDPLGVLRISIGGNVGFGYCRYRGPASACKILLQQALEAVEIEETILKDEVHLGRTLSEHP